MCANTAEYVLPELSKGINGSEDMNVILQNEIRNLRNKCDTLEKAFVKSQEWHEDPDRSERSPIYVGYNFNDLQGSRLSQMYSPSPTHSHLSDVSSIQQNTEVMKELMKLIPKYDGSGGCQKLLEFIDAFEIFASNSKLSPETKLILAMAKLSREASS